MDYVNYDAGRNVDNKHLSPSKAHLPVRNGLPHPHGVTEPAPPPFRRQLG